MTASDPLLRVSGLRVTHQRSDGADTILAAVDLHIGRGETVGLVGESGSGKSMLAKAVLRLLPPRVHANGSVDLDGTHILDLSERAMSRLRGEKVTLLYQDPFTMLNPLLTAGGHLVEAQRAGRDRGRRPSAAAARLGALTRLAEVGITDPTVAKRYPFQLSGGMRQRVALATALARDPELLIADEPSTALDVTTQAEILALLKNVQRDRGMSLLLITHDLRVAFSTCDRIYVLYAGSVLEVARPAEMQQQPLHPYTQGLLRSEPSVERRLPVLTTITGAVPRPDDVGHQCVFAPRCAWATDVCRSERPELVPVGADRLSACARIADISDELAMATTTLEAAVDEIPTPSSDVPALLRIRGLRKVFGRSNRQTVAVDGIDLDVYEGESVGLVGESGSGKTTVGRCVVGLETATSGTLMLAGQAAHDYAAVDADTRSRLRRTAQIIFQDPYSSLDPQQTVGRALLETFRVNGVPRSTARSRVGELLEAVGLPAHYTSRLPAALSGGERQRVAIARALAVGPQLIVCDEPVSALDVSVQAQVLSVLRDVHRRNGISFLFITHDLAVVRQIVDRVYVLYRGKIVEHGSVADVLDHPTHEYTQRLVASIPRPPTAGAEPSATDGRLGVIG